MKSLPQFPRPDNGKRANGVELWRGASSVDGKPIVAIAVGLIGSTNSKTGNMIQTYILRQDISPTAAATSGDDVSICGGCKHRPSTGGGCYVVVCQGPAAVWKAWKAGKYPTAANLSEVAEAGNGRDVRLGSYGDPVAVPAIVWESLIEKSTGHTGYTHQWRRDIGPGYMHLLQASVDNPEEYEKARRIGWGTFRVRTESSPVLPGEKVCPASAEGGHRAQCWQCKGCDGASENAFVIITHGGKARKAKVA